VTFACAAERAVKSASEQRTIGTTLKIKMALLAAEYFS
jgi:hypothetical protein